jgi:hypothetical protein
MSVLQEAVKMMMPAIYCVAETNGPAILIITMIMNANKNPTYN